MMRVYLAGPLFSLAERSFNETLALKLEQAFPSLQVILPQRHAAEIGQQPNFCQHMFAFSLDAIDAADAVVALLDGADADSGTCVEIGYARGKGKRVIGVRTDFRASEDRGLNLMAANVCSLLLLESSATATIDGLVREIVAALAAGTSCR
jgi:nucleoside 2-deoxyribosyltransferase